MWSEIILQSLTPTFPKHWSFYILPASLLSSYFHLFSCHLCCNFIHCFPKLTIYRSHWRNTKNLILRAYSRRLNQNFLGWCPRICIFTKLFRWFWAVATFENHEYSRKILFCASDWLQILKLSWTSQLSN